MPGKHQMFITRVSRWLSGMTDCSRNHGGSIAQRVRRRENPKTETRTPTRSLRPTHQARKHLIFNAQDKDPNTSLVNPL